MTIRVRGSSDFRKVALTAFDEIGPCDQRAFIADGQVQTVLGNDCQCLCSHPAGSNLLRDLDSWNQTLTIKPSAVGSGSSFYNYNDNYIIWDSQDYEMNSDHDMCGGVATTPSIMLAHEMVHALHDKLNTLQLADPQEEEFAAVRGENQVRLELCWPPRIEYGDPVPNYNLPDISTIGPTPCNCGSSWTSFFPISNHLRCARHISGRCHSPVIAIKNLVKLIITSTPRDRRRIPPMQQQAAFEQMLGDVDDDVANLIRFALRRRAASEHYERAERLTEAMLASSRGFALESVDIGGRHRVIVVRAVDGSDPGSGRVVMDTNLKLSPAWRPPSSEMFVGPTGAFETKSARTQGDRRPDLPEFPPGASGDAGTIGGTAHLLTVKDGDTIRRTVIYGYTHPAFHEFWSEPSDEDLPRWKAVNRAFEIWRDWMSDDR